MLKKNEIGPQTYRDAMARFAGAVHVVTTDGPAGKRGATVIAACSVSDTPPTVLVCLNRENPKNEAFIRNGNFALNTLATHQQALAEAFSGQTGLPVEERFALAEWARLSSGAPTFGNDATFGSSASATRPSNDTAEIFGRSVIARKSVQPAPD